jgi:hypothetical protein
MLEKFSFDVKRLESRRSAAAGASRCDLSLPFLSKWTVGMATHDSSSQPNLCSIPNRDIFYFCIWEMKKTREKKTNNNNNKKKVSRIRIDYLREANVTQHACAVSVGLSHVLEFFLQGQTG